MTPRNRYVSLTGCILYLAIMVSAQDVINVHAVLNNVTSVTAYQDEPVVLSLTLNNASSEDAEIQNTEIDWFLEIVQDSVDQGLVTRAYYDQVRDSLEQHKLDIGTFATGTPNRPWHSSLQLVLTEQGDATFPVSLAPCGDVESVLQLTGSDRAFKDFRIAGELPPGTHILKVQIDSFRSNVLTLKVEDFGMPQMAMLSPSQLIDIGNRYLQCDDGEKAMQYARGALERDPDWVAALMLMGDAYDVLGQPNEALNSFKKALEEFNIQFPNEYELPEYLLGRIADIEQRLNK